MNKVNHYQLTHPWIEFDRNWIRATSIIKIGRAGLLKKSKFTIKGATVKLVWPC